MFSNLNSSDYNDTLSLNKDDTEKMLQELKIAECGPNIGSILYIMGNSVHNKLFWSIIIYNFVFVIVPVIGNVLLSIYLMHNRALLKVKLDLIIQLNKRDQSNYLVENTENDKLDEKTMEDVQQVCTNNHRTLKLNEFHTEFLRSCTPCIAFSLTHVILFLPYSIIDTINQVKPYISFMVVLQYMTYVRYLFYGCKFYLLFLVSFKFRKEFREFFGAENCRLPRKSAGRTLSFE